MARCKGSGVEMIFVDSPGAFAPKACKQGVQHNETELKQRRGSFRACSN